ncbi:MAG: phosphomannomutase/phosphoglucomutase [Anaerolineae bacterium]|nr:phosphomannomutase/phosphoglucomutase [Anaerolineae bacterium]
MPQVTINREMFRAYDIRGVVGEDLTADVVNRIAKAIGTYLGRGGARRVVAGHDVRSSSVEFHSAMMEGLQSTGLDVLDIGLVPTPLMYFAVKHFGTDGGVVITASHNPPQFNGIKVRQGTLPLVSERLQEVADLAERGDFASGSGGRQRADATAPYIATVSRKFRLARPLRVVVDAGNGCAGLVAPPVLSAIGCDVVPLYTEPDGTFPHHHPDPMKEANLQDLKAKVRETRADVGLAFDGDGDRLGIVDDKGNTVTPNEFIALLARRLLPERPGAKVVFEVKVSRMLIEEVERLGGELVMTRVGYPFLVAAMKEHRALMGGEMSGHYYFDDPDIDFDDGTFASAVLADALAAQPVSLSGLVSQLPRYPATPEITVPCPDDRKFRVVERLRDAFAQDHKVITIDGARVLFERGWGVVRASNTEPRLTLRFEAETEADLQAIMAQFRQALVGVGLVPTF